MKLKVFCVALLCSVASQASQAQGGVDLDLEEKACSKGFGLSCQVLGTHYLLGSGVPKSESKAADLYRQACDYGNKEGCRYLGALHALGKGVTQDYGRAVVYFQKSCDGGDSEGCRLGALARADKEREDSLRTPSVAPSPAPVRAPAPAESNPGTPVSPGGVKCGNAKLVAEENLTSGSARYTRYTYELTNQSNCGPILIWPVAQDHKYHQRRLEPGQLEKFLCFHGVSHEPDCGEGLIRIDVRSAE